MTMLHDPDELLLQIRAPEIRKYADESVRALRAGAFRAAVLCLWVAVNSDIIGKIRELAASGDAQANAKIIELEKWIQNKELPKLQAFEQEILTLARDTFVFLTPIEADELERLRQDRHRCAHPALTPDGILYDPTPEQIRTHLVVATRALLAHPPIQGRSALKRLQAEVSGQTFPLEAAQVTAYLGPKYLDRGKEVLVAEIVKVHLQQALAETPDVPRPRAIHVVLAVKDRRPAVYQRIISEHWAKRVAAAAEPQLPFVIELLRLDPTLWALLPEHEQMRLITFVEQAPASRSQTLLGALQFPPIQEAARKRLTEMSADELVPILKKQDQPQRDLALLVVERLKTVDTYKAAGQFLDVINGMLNILSEQELREVLIAARENNQIYDAHLVAPSRLRQTLNNTKDTYPELAPEWTALILEHPKTWFSGLRSDLQDLNWLPTDDPAEEEDTPVTAPA